MSDSEEVLTPPPPPILKTPPHSTTTTSEPGSASPPTSIADGDWTCEDCDNVNFARRTACNRCNKARPSAALLAAAARKRKLGTEIGKAAAEKSRGLFSADDWQCNKCGNVNWARRQQCNVCNAPKFGDVEERTGFGGGYNDRGVVEYKERQSDSDDEYDEFGRRKKKRENSYRNDDDDVDPEDKREDSRVDKRDKPVVEEEEEEEDDDDEDGDLSKYDLSDWGDLPPAPVKTKSRSKSPILKI